MNYSILFFLPANFSARVRASVVLELGASSEFSVVGGFNMFSIENGDASMLILKQMNCFTIYTLHFLQMKKTKTIVI